MRLISKYKVLEDLKGKLINYFSIYLKISFTSAETGKSWYIFGSYASGSGDLYSFCPPAPCNICDDGESEAESSCVSSLCPG